MESVGGPVERGVGGNGDLDLAFGRRNGDEEFFRITLFVQGQEFPACFIHRDAKVIDVFVREVEPCSNASNGSAHYVQELRTGGHGDGYRLRVGHTAAYTIETATRKG